jgi:hypothetical protein
MVDTQMVTKVREFVVKYTNQGFTPRNTKGYRNNHFFDEIADAVSEFQEAEAKYSNDMEDWKYSSKLETLNKLINENNSNFYLIDNEMLKEIKNLQEKCTEVEKERDLNKSLLDKCRVERESYKTKYELCDQDFKKMFKGNRTQAGEVNDR